MAPSAEGRNQPGPETKDETESQSEELRVQLRTMKQEIDGLQIAAAETTKPWYRQPSVTVAALALIFSFGTTFYSCQRSDRQDAHDAKVELRELIQRLIQIPVANLDLDRKYAQRPEFRLHAAAFSNAETIVLSQQALNIIDEIPEEVTSQEYTAIATALRSAGDYPRALSLYQRALAAADNAVDWSGAVRGVGSAAFLLGDVVQAREAYRRALDVFKRFPTRNRGAQASTHAYTHLLWGQEEIGLGYCAEGNGHLAEAASLISANQLTTFQDQLVAARRSAAARCPDSK